LLERWCGIEHVRASWHELVEKSGLVHVEDVRWMILANHTTQRLDTLCSLVKIDRPNFTMSALKVETITNHEMAKPARPCKQHSMAAVMGYT
jgi:hypothetical protein